MVMGRQLPTFSRPSLPFGIRVVRQLLRPGGVIPKYSMELNSRAIWAKGTPRTYPSLIPSGPGASEHLVFNCFLMSETVIGR